jgi:hypothetical protein
MNDQRDLLPSDEVVVLGTWACQALAAELAISEEEAKDLLAAAYDQGRVQVLGNSYFAGVQCDGRWVVVEGRARITAATREWQTLRHLQCQFDNQEER